MKFPKWLSCCVLRRAWRGASWAAQLRRCGTSADLSWSAGHTWHHMPADCSACCFRRPLPAARRLLRLFGVSGTAGTRPNRIPHSPANPDSHPATEPASLRTSQFFYNSRLFTFQRFVYSLKWLKLLELSISIAVIYFSLLDFVWFRLISIDSTVNSLHLPIQICIAVILLVFEYSNPVSIDWITTLFFNIF